MGTHQKGRIGPERGQRMPTKNPRNIQIGRIAQKGQRQSATRMSGVEYKDIVVRHTLDIGMKNNFKVKITQKNQKSLLHRERNYQSL